ncbi:MAG TPA: DUF6146 family protein [Draconibacterium sp.]|nr:DUF6146 family protein [Draconibacterium sp.]
MKQLFIVLAVLLIFWACSGPKGVGKVEIIEPKAEADSIEYGVETFDGKFESWYAQHKSPATYRSLEYYENWNKQYVNEWNYKASQPGKNSFFEPIVGYNPNEKYGFDVNHELFYYFQYVENVLKIQILPGGPKAVQY